MPRIPLFPFVWPRDPIQLTEPPAAAVYPTTMDELDILELAEAAALLRIVCGRGQLPLKNPRRAILCVLASIVEYEIYKREHH